jgi:hypothetical protein
MKLNPTFIKKRPALWAALLAGALGIAALIYFRVPLNNRLNILFVQTGVTQIYESIDYVTLSEKDMVKGADTIFVGKVIEITPTRWNQDNGEYWRDETAEGDLADGSAMRLHTIKFEPSQFMVNKLGLDEAAELEVTVWGQNPNDSGAEPQYDLTPGDQVVFFIHQTGIVWRGNTMKQVMMPMQAPALSYFKQQADGLYEGKVIVNGAGGSFPTKGLTLSLDALKQEIADKLSQ